MLKSLTKTVRVWRQYLWARVTGKHDIRETSPAEEDYECHTFIFGPETIEVIEQLRVHFKCNSHAEVIRKSLALLQLAVQTKQAGGDIGVIDADGTQHIIDLGLLVDAPLK